LAYFFIAGNESSLATKMLELLKVNHLASSSFKEIQKNETLALGEMILSAINHQLKND
jgi:hypothetical protein